VLFVPFVVKPGKNMSIPTLAEAQHFLAEAAQLNPGPWVQHSQYVAQAARLIAAEVPGLDTERAEILGLMHDIGRRFGVTDMRHVLDGYRFLAERDFEDAGRICLTHSYPFPNAHSGSSTWDGCAEEFAFLQSYLDRISYNEYDRLVQLCDALALPSGFCLVEKRLLDVTLRYGFNVYTLDKWKAILQIQRHFEEAIGQSIYDLLPGVVENTFLARIL
jgi:hypothetical protein